MTSDELIADAEAIAKPCFTLAASGQGQVMGYWGGSRADLSDEFPPEVKFERRRHIASVDGALLARLGTEAPALVSLYEWIDRDEDSHLVVETDARKPWATLGFSGEPLYATERVSFPPFEALCLHGSARVGDWLRSLGLGRYQYWKAPREIVEAYARTYQARLGELHAGADLVVGGWHDMWPEDDYYMPAEMTYVLRTLRDAEPWYTVWYSPMSRGCFARTHVT
ncbi:MAG TPA: hypothetical protein VFZ53_07045 [Polyangiaceae bacterium]